MIRSRVFEDCHNLIGITIPANVSIENGAFTRCQDITIYCSDSSPAHTFAADNNLPYVFIGGQCGDNAQWWFDQGTLFITGFGDMYSFTDDTTPWYSYRTLVKRVIVGNGITRIGNCAFHGFTCLQDIELPDGLLSIGSRVFRLCKQMKNISIPNSVKEIGQTSFDGCYSLESFDFTSNMNTISYRLFNDCTSITFYILPDGMKSIEKWAFLNNSSLEWVLIPATVSYIDDLAFEGCGAVTILCRDGSAAYSYARQHEMLYYLLDTPLDNSDFVLPSSITEIEDEAFFGIKARRIKLPESVESIGSNAFSNCSNLVGIYIPRECSFIANNAFANSNTDLTIFGYSNSVAEYYARDNDMNFVSLD